jgi:hypothetical protein
MHTLEVHSVTNPLLEFLPHSLLTCLREKQLILPVFDFSSVFRSTSSKDWNELHHLLIMESLGGNAEWSDRFLGYHAAFAYYWFLVLVYLGSPRIAYQFMELLEVS